MRTEIHIHPSFKVKSFADEGEMVAAYRADRVAFWAGVVFTPETNCTNYTLRLKEDSALAQGFSGLVPTPCLHSSFRRRSHGWSWRHATLGTDRAL